MSALFRIFLITGMLCTAVTAADVIQPDPPRPGDDGPIRPPMLEPVAPLLVDPLPDQDGIEDPGREEGLRPRHGVPRPTPDTERPVEDAGGTVPAPKALPPPPPPGSEATHVVPAIPAADTLRPGLLKPQEPTANPFAGPRSATVPPATDTTPQPGFVPPESKSK